MRRQDFARGRLPLRSGSPASSSRARAGGGLWTRPVGAVARACRIRRPCDRSRGARGTDLPAGAARGLQRGRIVRRSRRGELVASRRRSRRRARPHRRAPAAGRVAAPRRARAGAARRGDRGLVLRPAPGPGRGARRQRSRRRSTPAGPGGSATTRGCTATTSCGPRSTPASRSSPSPGSRTSITSSAASRPSPSSERDRRGGDPGHRLPLRGPARRARPRTRRVEAPTGPRSAAGGSRPPRAPRRGSSSAWTTCRLRP